MIEYKAVYGRNSDNKTFFLLDNFFKNNIEFVTYIDTDSTSCENVFCTQRSQFETDFTFLNVWYAYDCE
jgi:hypothetical protein